MSAKESTRQSVSQEALLQILLDQTQYFYRKDTNFLGEKIEFCRCLGQEPNWDAKINIAGSLILSAFAAAKDLAKAQYNLDD